MSVRITSKDGNVKIVADDSSTVKNIVINGEDVMESRVGGWDDVAMRLLVYTGIVIFCGACWGLFFMGCESLAHGSPLDCEAIKEPDWKNFCRADTKHDPSWCEFIKDKDIKARCRASVRK